MTSRSGRGRWQRILQAREQARAALGQGPEANALYGEPKRKTRPAPSPMPSATRLPEGPDTSVLVLSLGVAATKLGVSRLELEVMIDAGKVAALPTGFTRMIPTSEIERLKR